MKKFLILYLFFFSNVQKARATLDQEELILPRYIMQQYLATLTFPELANLELVNKGLLGLCSQAPQYKILAQFWTAPSKHVQDCHLENPRKKFLHMFYHMPIYQLFFAEMWMLYFPLSQLPHDQELPRTHYWPKALDAHSKQQIQNVFNRALDLNHNAFGEIKGRAILGLALLHENKDAFPYVEEIVNQQSLRLIKRHSGEITWVANLAYPEAIVKRGRILQTQISSQNYAQMLDKLGELGNEFFPHPKDFRADFQEEMARVNLYYTLGEMYCTGKGDYNLGSAETYFEYILKSPQLSLDQSTRIALRMNQIQLKDGRITEKEYRERVDNILDDPYTSSLTKEFAAKFEQVHFMTKEE